MPHVKHPGSQEGYIASVVGAATVPVTQSDLNYEGNWLWDEYQSNEAVSGVTPGQYISFTANPTFQSMTDVGQSFIAVQGFYKLAGDINIDSANTSVTAPPFLAATLFQDLSITMNGTQVVASQGITQPYAVVASVIKNAPASERENGIIASGYLLDPYNSSQTTAAMNTSSTQRQMMYMYGKKADDSLRPFSLTYRLADAGLRTNGSWLPPNVSMQIRARRTSPNWMRLGLPTDVAAANPVFTFTSAKLYVARKVLSVKSLERIENIWADQPLRVGFERIRTSVSWFLSGSQDINLTNQLSGPTPSAVFVFFVQDTAMNGTSTGLDNPMYLSLPSASTAAAPTTANPSAWQNVSLGIGGSRRYPIQPLSMLARADQLAKSSPSLDLSVMYQLYRACANDHPFLRDVDFTNVAPICFPIGSGSSDGWDMSEDVSVSFQARISNPTTANFSILMVSFTDSLIEFTRQGQVLVT
jgi:hypothetical protein